MADEPTPTPQPSGDPTPTGDTPKTYTEEEYNKLVAERDSFKESHENLNDLYSNERFRGFVEEENRRLALGDDEYNRIYGKTGDGDDTDDAGPDISGMSDEEKVAHLMEQVGTLNAELKGIKEERAQDKYTGAQNTIANELKTLETDTAKYPLFSGNVEKDGQEVPVRQLMKAELSKAVERGQDMTLDQAYKIVTYEAQRKLGRDDAERTLKEKREAARLGIPVSSTGRTVTSAKEYSSAREATEAVMEEMGL